MRRATRAATEKSDSAMGSLFHPAPIVRDGSRDGSADCQEREMTIVMQVWAHLGGDIRYAFRGVFVPGCAVGHGIL